MTELIYFLTGSILSGYVVFVLKSQELKTFKEGYAKGYEVKTGTPITSDEKLADAGVYYLTDEQLYEMELNKEEEREVEFEERAGALRV